MNKIKIVSGKLEKNIDSTIECDFYLQNDKFSVDLLKIKIKEDTNLELEIDSTDKLDIFINILEGVHVNIFEYTFSSHVKIQYKYYLEQNSNVEIKKINNVDAIKEYDIVNLNGENARFRRVLKTISKSLEKYDMLIYHNAKNTSSDLVNHGVNIENGNLIFNVSTFVPERISGCYANQSNRIINLTNSECKISPNMYIDCFDVIANHSAFIGSFSDEELFYLQSRGIPRNDATELLIKGFLTSELDESQKEKYDEFIKQYWG
ncbi:MAG: hypothetical protein E7173_01160 [Firmicutes bacterium]|nr:hypothetical protein [Bacillota bacterium]